jgi:hypothetical protein
MADLVAIGVPIYCGTAFIAETLRSGGQANRATLAMKNRLTAPFGKTGYAKIGIPSRAPSLRSLFECGVAARIFSIRFWEDKRHHQHRRGSEQFDLFRLPCRGGAKRGNMHKGERLRHASMRKSSDKTAGLTGVLKV